LLARLAWAQKTHPLATPWKEEKDIASLSSFLNSLWLACISHYTHLVNVIISSNILYVFTKNIGPYIDKIVIYSLYCHTLPPDHLLLDSVPNIGPLISRWELGNLKNSWNKSFRTSKILTLLYQHFSKLLVSQRDMSGPRLGALSNNRRSSGTLSCNII
jgi:hypothetical protein